MKYYSMVFTSGDPRTTTGLAPTFLIFVNMVTGATVSPPAITESLTGSGIYQFPWGTTQPIAFLCDGATTSAPSRYIAGQLDPVDRVDETNSNVGTLIGSTTSVYGGASLEPGDLFGYLKRIQETLEGNETFVKSSGVLNIFSRGSATLLISKTIANSASNVIKT